MDAAALMFVFCEEILIFPSDSHDDDLLIFPQPELSSITF